MRTLRLALVVSLVLFGLMNSAVTLGFEAGSARGALYLGEFCWQDPEGGIARLAITHMGHDHYIVHGRHTDTSGYVEAINGNAEIVGTQVIMHITTSSFDADEVQAFLATIVLDLPDMHGTIEGVNVYYDKPGGPGGVSYDGPMALTKIVCP